MANIFVKLFVFVGFFSVFVISKNEEYQSEINNEKVNLNNQETIIVEQNDKKNEKVDEKDHEQNINILPEQKQNPSIENEPSEKEMTQEMIDYMKSFPIPYDAELIAKKVLDRIDESLRGKVKVTKVIYPKLPNGKVFHIYYVQE